MYLSEKLKTEDKNINTKIFPQPVPLSCYSIYDLYYKRVDNIPICLFIGSYSKRIVRFEMMEVKATPDVKFLLFPQDFWTNELWFKISSNMFITKGYIIDMDIELLFYGYDEFNKRLLFKLYFSGRDGVFQWQLSAERSISNKFGGISGTMVDPKFMKGITIFDQMID